MIVLIGSNERKAHCSKWRCIKMQIIAVTDMLYSNIAVCCWVLSLPLASICYVKRKKVVKFPQSFKMNERNNVKRRKGINSDVWWVMLHIHCCLFLGYLYKGVYNLCNSRFFTSKLITNLSLESWWLPCHVSIISIRSSYKKCRFQLLIHCHSLLRTNMHDWNLRRSSSTFLCIILIQTTRTCG